MTHEPKNKDVDINERSGGPDSPDLKNNMLLMACRLAKVGGFRIYVDTMTSEWNDEMFLIHELDPGKTPSIEEIRAFFNPQSWEVFKQAHTEAIENNMPFSLELLITTSKGNKKWIKSFGNPVVENGRVIWIDGAAQDITAQHLLELETKEVSSIFQTFFDVTPDIYFLVDIDTTIIDYRASKESMLYAPPEVFLHKRLDEIMPPTVSVPFKQAVLHAKNESRLATFEYKLDMPEGEKWYECRAAYLKDKDLAMAIVRDITDQHSAIQQLSASELRFRRLLENAPFPILITRISDGTMRYGNKRAQTQLGFTVNEGVGSPSIEWYADPEDRPRFLEQLEKNGSVSDYEIRFLNWKHKEYWALVSAVVVEFENVPCVMVAINDISLRKKTEEDLRTERRILEQRLRERLCNQQVYEITEDDEKPLDGVLNELVKIIPPGWQYSEVTEVCIELDGQKYFTEGFRETPWMLVSAITTRDETEIRVTVAYTEHKHDHDEGPFLSEERLLLDAIAVRLKDVVDRRRGFTALREKDELVRIMFAQTSEAIALFDPVNGRYAEFNKAAHEMLGYTKEEFAELSVKDIQVEHTDDTIRTNIAAVLDGQTLHFESKHRCKNGETKDVDVFIMPFRYSGQPFLCVVWRDITEQKRHEREQQARMEKLQARAMIISAVNKYDTNLTGEVDVYTRELAELVGKKLCIPRVSFWRYNQEETILECVDLYKKDENTHSKGMMITARDNPEFFEMLKENAFVNVSEDTDDPREKTFYETYMKKVGATALLAYMVSYQGKAFGIYGTTHTAPGHKWQADDIVFCGQLADQIGIAIMNQSRVELTNALMISDEELKRAQAVSKTGYWHYDLQRKIFTGSEETHRIFGVELDASLSYDTWVSYIYPEDRDAAVRFFAESINEVSREIHYRITAGGKIKWVESRGETVFDSDENPVSVRGSIQDVTEKVEAAIAHTEITEALRKSEQALRRAQEVSKTGHWYYDYKAGTFTASDEMSRIFDLEQETELSLDGFQSMIHPDDAKRARASFDMLMAGEPSHIVYRIVTASQEKWVETNAACEAGADGSITAVLGTTQDVTENIQVTQELEKYRYHLEEMVAKRTVELEEAKIAAEDANRTKSLFLSNMSHEIRTPLTAILGYAEIIQRDQLSIRQIDQLQKLTAAANNLKKLISDLLDFSQIEAGKINLKEQNFEPAQVLESLSKMVEEDMKAKNLNLIIKKENMPAAVKGDSQYLSQILLNIVSNAVKFTHQGHVTISGTVAGKKDDKIILRFEVEDTGIGMSDEQLSRLFRDFEQADGSATRNYGGMGLGLSMSRKLAELMSGHIRVRSKLGQGTTFFVDIPFAPVDMSVKNAISVKSFDAMHVIVIDDSEDDRTILSDMLASLGLSPDTASSGMEGLKAVIAADNTEPYECVIVDLKMPVMDGLETVRRLRNLQLKKPPTVLMVTAYGNETLGLKIKQCGISRVLEKPVSRSSLINAIGDLFDYRGNMIIKADSLCEGLDNRMNSHVLLVEDNQINREVIGQLLIDFGMKVSFAENGRIAVDMAMKEKYDLIFMDLQMPVMDGFQATREIRKQPGLAKLPIVAITANAFDEDRKKCLDAGMDDHLGKPVDVEKLCKCLLKYLPENIIKNETSDNVGKEIGTVRGADTHKIMNSLKMLEFLDVEMGLRSLLGKLDKYAALLLKFAENHCDDAKTIISKIKEKDMKSIQESAHALKGVSGTLGIRIVQGLAANLESMAKNTTGWEEIESTANVLANELDRTTASIYRVLASMMKTDKITVHSEEENDEVGELLAQLEKYLYENNSLANEFFDENYDIFEHQMGDTAFQLKKHIGEFDYGDALNTLRNYLKA